MKKKTNQQDVKDLFLLIPRSLGALFRAPAPWDPNEDLAIDDEDVYLPVLYSISSVIVFKVLIGSLLKDGVVKSLIEIHNGDTKKAAMSIGTFQALGALLEFIIGPLYGKLSDVYGRKRLMSLNPLVVLTYTTLLALNSKSLWVYYLRIPLIAMDTAFFSTMNAMMADVMSGPNRAQNGTIHMVPAGLATAFAPFIAAQFSRSTNFWLAVLCSATMVRVMKQLRETLPPKSRQPASSIDFASCNPFSFVRLLTNGRALATLSFVSCFQTYTDPRMMDETAIIVMREKLGWEDQQVQRQLGAMSLSIVFGVPVGKFSVKTLGRIGHTHLAHFMKAVGYVLWSRAATAPVMRFTQFVMVFGQRQRDGVETLISDIGSARNMGKGQIEAWKFNFRSVSNFFAPLVYARLFAYGKSIDHPAFPFLGAVGFVSLAELIMCSLPQSVLDAETQ